jgi:glycosyltransferase involved in cell wall biosynthesis
VLIIETHGGIGGLQRVTLDLVQAVDRSRFAPELLFLSRGESVDEAESRNFEVSLLELHGAGHSFARRVTSLLGAVRRAKPAIVQANGIVNLFEILVACQIARVPVVWYQQDPYESRRAHARKLVLGVTSLPPRATIFATQIAQRSIAPRIRTLRNIHVITNGVVAPERIDASTAPLIGFGIERRRPLVAMFGRVTALKRPDVFVAAAGVVAARHPGAAFVIVGPVDDRDRQILERQIVEHGLAGIVTLTGSVDEEAKWQLLAAADVVVHPSQYEPFGLAVVEAMLAGTPVVAAESWGPQWIIRDGETGLLVPIGDSSRTAAAVLRLLDLPNLARRLAAAGREDALQRFQFASTASAIQDVWAEMSRTGWRRCASSGRRSRA